MTEYTLILEKNEKVKFYFVKDKVQVPNDACYSYTLKRGNKEITREIYKDTLGGKVDCNKGLVAKAFLNVISNYAKIYNQGKNLNSYTTYNIKKFNRYLRRYYPEELL